MTPPILITEESPKDADKLAYADICSADRVAAISEPVRARANEAIISHLLVRDGTVDESVIRDLTTKWVSEDLEEELLATDHAEELLQEIQGLNLPEPVLAALLQTTFPLSVLTLLQAWTLSRKAPLEIEIPHHGENVTHANYIFDSKITPHLRKLLAQNGIENIVSLSGATEEYLMAIKWMSFDYLCTIRSALEIAGFPPIVCESISSTHVTTPLTISLDENRSSTPLSELNLPNPIVQTLRANKFRPITDIEWLIILSERAVYTILGNDYDRLLTIKVALARCGLRLNTPFQFRKDMDIFLLDWSARTAECFKSEGISTLERLAQKTEGEMIRTLNFWRKSLNEAKAQLARFGLRFGMTAEGVEAVLSGMYGQWISSTNS